MILVEPAKMFDVDFVLDDLSFQHRAEHRENKVSRADVMRKFEELIDAEEADTIWIDDKPAAVIGVSKEEELWTTWFVATPAYFSAGIRAIRHARRYLARARENHGPLFLVVPRDRPKLHRWLRLLGYTKMSDSEQVSVFAVT